eukprot:4539166-Prymnesium_polylepis.1
MASQVARQHAKKKRCAALEAKRAQQEAVFAAKFESWMKTADKDNDGSLDETEIKALLLHLHPERPPTDEHVQMLVSHLTDGSNPKE